MKRAQVTFLLMLLAGGAVLVFSDSGFPASQRADVKKGEALYARKCAVCHGREGKGDGPAELVLFPKPRDLTSGQFKIRSTPTLPTSDDLFRVITLGIPGTAMPGWAALPESERRDLVAYVKHLSPAFARFPGAKPVRIPPAPQSTPALLEVGKKFYVEAECLKCHGETGRGDGEAADTLKDDWGVPIVPYDFTIPGRMKGGNTAKDIYRALVTGIGGTPMPSYADSLSEREIWGLAYYTMSLAQQPETKAPPEAGIVVVRRVTDDLRMDPNALVWRKAGLQAVPLRTLWLRPNTIDQVRVVALHNGREIGFLLEWDDPISDLAALTTEKFRDAAAIQFPLQAAALRGAGHPEPNYVMGDVPAPVNTWYWKADWQLGEARYPDLEDRSGMIRSFALPRRSPVENLNAVGVGTITSQPVQAQLIKGEGRWGGGKWRVVMVRSLKTGNPLDVQFEPGQSTVLAFAVWDGAQGDRDGQKAVSVWQRLLIRAGN